MFIDASMSLSACASLSPITTVTALHAGAPAAPIPWTRPLPILAASSYFRRLSSPHANYCEPSFPIKKKWVWPFVSWFGCWLEILGNVTCDSGHTPISLMPLRIANFSTSLPNPESIIKEPVLYAALAIPAIVLPDLGVIAPERITTGVGCTNLRRSAISLMRKS